ncbi:bifunctional diguanylate cyclase/phosphodiesterase [Clostridium sp. BJN0001]|uniref:putative bifunctional diguanylate cyclase/phosphodiesterase n=1 Tax=Clostridium sp. BJN0001 TaxID=2930219 RepID=UPI001FD32C0B|nr:bifunctional diguanylate cyclase/phosphodiesterase [Clostridium sp. BJN0001]
MDKNRGKEKIENLLSQFSNKNLMIKLMNTYDIIYELNINEDKYRLFKINPENNLRIRQNGSYNEFILRLIKRASEDCDKKVIKDNLSFEHLKYKLEMNNYSYCEAHISNRDTKKCFLYSFLNIRLLNNGHITSICFVKNLSSVKENSDSILSYSKQLNFILKKSYSFILSVDINKKTYYYQNFDNNINIDSVKNKLAYDDFIIYMAEKTVYADDRDIFYDTLKMKNIEMHFSNTKNEMNFNYRAIKGKSGYIWKTATCILIPSSSKDKKIIFILSKNIDDIYTKNFLNNCIDENRKDDIFVENKDLVIFEQDYVENKGYIIQQGNNRFPIKQTSNNIIYDILNSGVICEADLDNFTRVLRGSLTDNNDNQVICRIRNVFGIYEWCMVCFIYVKDMDGKILKLIGTLKDMHESMDRYRGLKFKTECDLLTGLANSEQFTTKVKEVLRKRLPETYAIISFDINNFKVINELYGMEMGNQVLIFVAKILDDILGDDKIVARFSNDFFYIFTDYDKEDELVNLVETIAKRLHDFSSKFTITVSFGIYKITNLKHEISGMCDRANLAKKEIKGNIVHLYSFYDATIRTKILEDRDIENKMENALKSNQFLMYLQPKYNIESSEIIGAEALVRWNDPEKGLVYPYKFIPLFEKNGFVVNVDRFIWEQACKTIRNWIDMGYKPVPISVNVSRLHIYNTKFIAFVKGLLKKYDISTNLLELEVTESALFEKQDEFNKVLSKLKEEGFVLEMDDFGSGYSSLNMLKDSPVDVVKIDREFLNEVMESKRGKSIISHTISMINDIGLRVVAEGVENKLQADFLLNCGCNIAQGYYYSKPITVSEFEKKLKKTKNNATFL